MSLIEKAGPKDIPVIQNLAETSWKSAYANILSKEQLEFMLHEMYNEKALSQQLNSEDWHYYLGYDSTKTPSGFIGFQVDYEPGVTMLHRIYLLPESKGQGLGSLLISKMVEVVKTQNQREILLRVNRHNTAKLFYEKCGFRVYAEDKLDIGHGFVMDDYLMRKPV